MSSACDAIEDVIEDFHQYLIDVSSNLWCDDVNKMLQAESLIKHMGGTS